MATRAQINANRANAQKSTGPRTPEGKAKSCLNHFSHGFTAATLMIDDEDRAEFDGLFSDLTNEFQPATSHEQILLEKMVHNHWLSLRALRLQSLMLLASVHHHFIHQDLGVLIRYQTSADRAYLKFHSELLKAQKERKKSEIGFESQKVVKASEAPVESPRQPPAATEKDLPQAAPDAPQAGPDVKNVPANENIPDFTPSEIHLLTEMGLELGMDIEELKRPDRLPVQLSRQAANQTLDLDALI